MNADEREQRLVFGEVADDYDRVRPSYPDQLIDDVLAFADIGEGGRALEIGAGTGRATLLFAARGVAVTALEPSPEMAEVCHRNLAGYLSVRIEPCLFEEWAGGDGYPLIYAAQAWHWVPPDVRATRAADLLAGGGVLALFWNFPHWDRSPDLRARLDEVYERLAPDLPTWGPGSTYAESAVEETEQVVEIDACERFEAVEVRDYRHPRRLDTAEYLALLGTQSDHRLLAGERRTALFDAVEKVIDGAGGVVDLDYDTRLYVARRRA